MIINRQKNKHCTNKTLKKAGVMKQFYTFNIK